MGVCGARDKLPPSAAADDNGPKRKKLDKVYRVFGGVALIGLIFGLWCKSLAQSQDQSAQRLGSYSVSVQQLRVSSRVRAHLAKAERDFRSSHLETALAEVQRAMHEDAACADAFVLRALIDLARKNPAEGIADAMHATSLDPNNPQAFLALATAYNSSQSFERAEQPARQALKLLPSLWQARLEIAKSLYLQEKLIPALRELDALRTDFADVHLVRGDVLLRLGRGPEAVGEFGAFLAEAPRDARCQQIRQIVEGISPHPRASF